MEASATTRRLQLTLRDKKLDYSTPKIMGILNATPDSFSDGGKFNDVESALAHIKFMISQGASIIDVGGESTRPGAEPISAKQELERTMPILERAINQFPDTLFSIDTTKFSVAQQALESGAHFVNDISGLQQEPRLAHLCGKYNAGYILMHSQGTPDVMQENPSYDDVVADIKAFFAKKIQTLQAAGVQAIILDPGIGFGKNLHHNIKIIQNLSAFRRLGLPVMIGASRKSSIGKILNGRPANDRLIGTVVAHYHALLKGANLLRVHDVKEANDSILMYNAINEIGS